MTFQITNTDVLVVIDPQNDFCPGGALVVPGGNEIMEDICELSKMFTNIVVTQDWHPRDQISFASNHENGEPFSAVNVAYGDQVLWPDHCIQGTSGADFERGILPVIQRAQAIIRKGTNPEVDSYSAFFENDKKTDTGLNGYLKNRIKRCFFVGLAYDFCVGFSAIDAVTCGFESVVIKDATRAIGLNGSIEQIELDFQKYGVKVASINNINI